MKATLVLALLALAPAARGMQNLTGTTAAQFLTLGVGARSLGMGEAYMAVADGADAAYWNPGGLAVLTRPELAYSRSELGVGLHEDFAAVAVPSQLLHGTMALAVTRLSQDSMALVDNQDNADNPGLGSFSPHSEVYALAYGTRLAGDNGKRSQPDAFRDDWGAPAMARLPAEAEDAPAGVLAAGASVKLIEESLGTRQASAFAVDGGALFRPQGLPELTLAGVFRNIGSKERFIADSEPLPGELDGSAAYEARAGYWRVISALEADVPYAGNPYGKIGFEVSRRMGAVVSAALRLGYSSRMAPDLGLLAGLSAGVGLRIGHFSFDGAFQEAGALGESFRLGVGWRF